MPFSAAWRAREARHLPLVAPRVQGRGDDGCVEARRIGRAAVLPRRVADSDLVAARREPGGHELREAAGVALGGAEDDQDAHATPLTGRSAARTECEPSADQAGLPRLFSAFSRSVCCCPPCRRDVSL
jgi:hypothetical protein